MPPSTPATGENNSTGQTAEAFAMAPTTLTTMIYELDSSSTARPGPGVPPLITRRLYVSHFLSTWNSRSFEFGAVLFLAGIFPRTLLQLSIYALLRSASAIILASAIGRAVDQKHRLTVVRFSIGKNHRTRPSVMQYANTCCSPSRCTYRGHPLLYWLLGTICLYRYHEVDEIGNILYPSAAIMR